MISLSNAFLKQVVAQISRTVPLQTVLIVPFVLQTLVTVGLVGYFSFRNRQEAINDLASQLRRELTNRIEGKLQTYTEIPHNINRLNASTFAQGKIDASAVKGEFPLWQQIQIYPMVSDIYCGDRNGSLLGVRRSPADNSIELRSSNVATDHKLYGYSLDRNGQPDQLVSQGNKTFDARLRPWFKAAVTAGEPVWSGIYADFASQLPTITASTPVYSTADRSLLGVCATDVFLPNEMSRFLASLQIGKTGIAFILERSGQLVATSTGEAIISSGAVANRLSAVESRNPTVRATAAYLRDHFSNLWQIQTAEQLDFNFDGRRQLIQVMPFKDTRGLDWLIVTVLPESDFMAKINQNIHTTILLCIAALLLGIAICILIARWITKPIVSVSQSAKALADGAWDQTVEIERSGDLGELARSFNQMAQQLQIAFAKMQSLNQTLAQSETRLQKILESIPVGIAVLDATGHPYYANQKAIQLLGKGVLPSVSPEQIAEAYQLYVAGTDRPYPTEQLMMIRALNGEQGSVDDIEIHQGNRIIPIESWGTPIFDESGNILYAIAAFQDITDRKQAEKLLSEYSQTLEQQVTERTLLLSQEIEERQQVENALRQSEEQRRLTMDFSYIGSWNWNIVENITEWNDNHVRLLGLVPGEVKSSYQAWRDRVHLEDIERVEQAVAVALATHTDFETEYRVIYPDGTIHWLVGRGRGIYNEAGQPVRMLGVILDISDRKRAEAASILEERNRMAREIHDTLAQAFTGVLVHMGTVSQLVTIKPEAVQTHIDIVRELARNGLIEARRSVAALRPQLLEDGNLWTALEQFVAMMQSSTESCLTYEVIGTPYALPADAENNLLRIGQEAFTNAIKYAQAKEIQIELVYEPTSCHLRIKDNGRGFEANTTTLSRGFGLLGMTERAEHIGALLSIESQLGQGTAVIVSIQREAAT
ncbi:PAS domain S-box protein [Leptolyngbya sp. FACHB-711]|uniref:PAS domain S-box protein n=1 Tax=unclassified Leptolyngbya TaxID=2650499 RepID=UPI001686656A|nr:PAS domain S-box protein [Leptolyngbya sp. FACHB-711]MBD1850980.1 PAS domain S-box protein [Cyanobacteria bacterium FACHB-502]MBD2023914.1 PAS domain S-box protein [Leptolyngbya sp. FACHB-711]